MGYWRTRSTGWKDTQRYHDRPACLLAARLRGLMPGDEFILDPSDWNGEEGQKRLKDIEERYMMKMVCEACGEVLSGEW